MKAKYPMLIVFFLLSRVNAYAEDIYTFAVKNRTISDADGFDRSSIPHLGAPGFRPDVLHLKNGDKISGEIIEENAGNISVQTEAMGVITVKRDFLERIVGAEEQDVSETSAKVREIIWKREASLGYNKSSGNTENSQLSIGLAASRKIEQVNEITFQGDLFNSTANEKMDAQKWYAMARYAFSFGQDKHWYNFYKFESDHDRFANIDYRLTPSGGIGYWFSDQPDWKMMVEAAIGFEHTNFRDDTKDSNEAILIPRAFFEKALFAKSTITQDIRLYSSLEDFGEFRVHSETALNTALTEKLSLRLSIIDDYDSDVPEGVKKNDFRLISSLVSSF